MIPLRPYQAEGLRQLHARMAAGARRVVTVLPTGGGKTVLACYPINSTVRRGGRALFIAPFVQLVDQARAKLIEYGLPRVGIIMGRDSRTDPGAPVQVASWETLTRRDLPAADLVVVDEVHLAVTKARIATLETYSQAHHMLLTATPWPAAREGLKSIADELITIATPRKLISEGWLVAPRLFTCELAKRPDLSGIAKTAGDYNLGQLETRMMERRIVGNVVEHWLERAGGRRTVVFASSVAHSQELTAAFRAAGVAAEHIDGTTPLDERRAILGDRDAGVLGRLQTGGETTVVVNCGVLTTGWDDPSVEVEVQARPTHSLTLYMQMAGRIMRPHPGKEALLLDPVGNYERHGLPHQDREYVLTSGPAKKEPVPKLATCPTCYAVFVPAPNCPECGTAMPRSAGGERRGLKRQEGQLREVTDEVAAFPSGEAKKLNSLLWVARDLIRKGRMRPTEAVEWARSRFNMTFGHDPSDELWERYSHTLSRRPNASLGNWRRP